MKELTMAALVAGATGLMKADVWDKTFPKSDKVEHCKAAFKNRFGITLVSDVYKPKEGNGELGTGNGSVSFWPKAALPFVQRPALSFGQW